MYTKIPSIGNQQKQMVRETIYKEGHSMCFVITVSFSENCPVLLQQQHFAITYVKIVKSQCKWYMVYLQRTPLQAMTGPSLFYTGFLRYCAQMYGKQRNKILSVEEAIYSIIDQSSTTKMVIFSLTHINTHYFYLPFHFKLYFQLK